MLQCQRSGSQSKIHRKMLFSFILFFIVCSFVLVQWTTSHPNNNKKKIAPATINVTSNCKPMCIYSPWAPAPHSSTCERSLDWPYTVIVRCKRAIRIGGTWSIIKIEKKNKKERTNGWASQRTNMQTWFKYNINAEMFRMIFCIFICFFFSLSCCCCCLLWCDSRAHGCQ